MWSMYQQGALTPIITEVYVTAVLLVALGARTVSLGVRMWQDEVEACEEDLVADRVPPAVLEDDKGRRMQAGESPDLMQ